MLRRLRIENLAVVEDVVLELGAGLNVLTGSTGAGKSLIVGAVNLLLGERVAGDVIRRGSDEARVEAEFAPADPTTHPLAALHASSGASLRIVRRVTRAGRSHAEINGRSVPIKELRAVCLELIEAHGQNEQYRLRDPDRHVEYVDALAQNGVELARYAEALADWRRARAELDRHDAEVAAMREKRELYAHRIEEIDRVAPRPGEKASLESTARLLAHAERIHAAMLEVCAAVYDDDDSAASRVGAVERKLGALSALDERIASIAEKLGQAGALLAEAASDARGVIDGLDFDADTVERTQERLDALVRIERRYNTAIEALIEQKATWVQALNDLDDGGIRRGALVEALSGAGSELARRGVELTRTRVKAAREMDRRVTRELQRLMMRGAAFRTDVRHAPAPEGSVVVDGAPVQGFENGLDVVRMRVQTNPGEAEGPIEAVASTGELSRVALVLKEITASGVPGATLIFDEIDAGIGADLGEVLSEKLLALAANNQIICITHMPQIAARGHSHLVVAKETDGNRTRVRVRAAEGDERTREIARMLGGEEGSERRLALAREMLVAGPACARSSAG